MPRLHEKLLECCWPGSPTSSSASSPVSSEAEAASPCIEIKPKLEEPKTPSIQAAYPSPEMSPVFEGKAENCDILSLSLPKGQFKVTKPKKVVKKPQEPTKFVITSVEKRRLVHVK